MTMMSINVSTSAASAPSAQAPAADSALPVQAAQAQAPATPVAVADAAQQAPAPVLAFARLLGQQVDSMALAQAAVPAVPGADHDAATGDSDDVADGSDSAVDSSGAAAQDNNLLAAMAMPLMPLTPMQIAQAVQAAQGAAVAMATGGTAPAGQGTDGDTAAQASGQSAAVGAVSQDGGRRADLALAQLAGLQAAQQSQQPQQPAQPQQDSAAVRLSLQSGAGNSNGNAAADAGTQDGSADHAAAPATPVAGAGVASAAPATQPAADTVKLAGPPTAWRQSLQEALGERLNVQVGKNMEQAVIRLEPPQLGRIDIAIRHSAGTLEVNITASNGEVLRQLQAVSDNLRSDLSQRQYTEVAVSVTPTPKNSSATPFGDPQQQGRGRQQGREQDDMEPGRALAEASNPTSVFSLAGRE
jgi:flagellar hook-length control protein FliK